MGKCFFDLGQGKDFFLFFCNGVIFLGGKRGKITLYNIKSSGNKERFVQPVRGVAGQFMRI
jgi:hypothetical protein